MTTSLSAINAVSLFVEDLPSAKAFYQEVFGVPVVFQDEVSAVFGFDNLMVNLLDATQAHTLVGPDGVAAAGTGSRDQLSIWVDDVDAVCASLEERGVTLRTGPRDQEWGMRTATFVDPAGHSWEVAQALAPPPAVDEVAPAVPGRAPTDGSTDGSTGLLLAHLGSQRRHVLGILEGLDDEALRRPVLPSGWSCLGLLQHLALDVERFWFRAVVAGDQGVIDGLDDTANAWQVDESVPAQSLLELYRQEIERSDAVLVEASADSSPAWWPTELFGSFRLDDVREILLHVIVETATHAGQLDAQRELLDGRQWLVLD